jgi:hypothetical protein
MDLWMKVDFGLTPYGKPGEQGVRPIAVGPSPMIAGLFDCLVGSLLRALIGRERYISATSPS